MNEPRTTTHRGDPMENFISRLSKDDAASYGQKLFVLRNKTRLRIIDLLERYGGMLCVAEIAAVLQEHDSVISNHLAVFRAVGLVERERYGAFMYYTLSQKGLSSYLELLEHVLPRPSHDEGDMERRFATQEQQYIEDRQKIGMWGDYIGQST